MIILREIQETIDQGDSGGATRQTVYGQNRQRGVNANEGERTFIPGTMPGGLSMKTLNTDDSSPAYNPIFTFSKGMGMSKDFMQIELLGSEVFKVGEFSISQYTNDSLLIRKEDGELMEVSLNTLRRFLDENY